MGRQERVPSAENLEQLAPVRSIVEHRIAGCLDLDQLLAVLASNLARLLPVNDRISIVFLEPDEEWMRIYRVIPAVDGPRGDLPRVRVDGTPVGQVVREGVGKVVADVRSDPNITFGHASHDGIRSTISAPIWIGGRVVGAMNAGSRTAMACSEAMLRQLADVAAIVGPAVYATEQTQAGAQVVDNWPTLEEHERRYIRRVLELKGGIIEGPVGAAQLLGMRPSTLRSRMKRLGISAQPMRAQGRK